MFESLFKNNEKEEKVKYEESIIEEENEASSENIGIVRTATLKILSSQIIYDSGEDSYETLATCINEEDEIETLNINGFKIDRTVSSLQGALIDIQVTMEDGEDYYEGKIHN